MSAKHTPGPWKLDGGGRQDHEREICCAAGWFLLLSAGYPFKEMANPREAEDEFEANARLIAAAPEMLEACKNLIASNGKPKAEEYMHPQAYALALEAYEYARAVIAKAEGRTP